jgi:phosphoribosylaminoimidazole-succinocarboxamide synthase
VTAQKPAKPIREYLAQLTGEPGRHAYAGLTPDQIKDLARRDMPTYTGKVRDVVQVPGDELLIVHSDRLSAFDRLIGMVPYKGTILTAISEFWLEEAKKVVPTHYRGRPHERVLRCNRTEPVKAEIIVRGYLAGSMQRAYEGGERVFCGVKLPEGLKPYGKLPTPIITPTTKAAAFEHDENVTAEELIERQVCTRAEWDEMSRMALALFAHGQKVFGEKGWILVDTKYEIGRTRGGGLEIIDEIHTPDSSRLWIASTYAERFAAGEAPEMLDKETVRRYLLSQGFKGHGDVPHVPVSVLVELAEVYLKVAETLTGKPVMTQGPDQTVDVPALAKLPSRS